MVAGLRLFLVARPGANRPWDTGWIIGREIFRGCYRDLPR